MSTGNILNDSSALNNCGCCAGIELETPATINNAPGLSAIAYRVGTYSQFQRSMRAMLSDARYPQLAALKTRSTDDLAPGVLNAWAVAADIITFYQERIANESYLRTAIERRSVLELARSIGYELRPGVAAGVYLAFTLDDTSGSSVQTTINVGTRAQSIPNPGEQPQTYETIAPISASSAWNAMQPRLTHRHPYKDGGKLLSTFYFDGIMTGLQVGDPLLLVPDDDNQPVLCRISAVTPQPDLNRTSVDLYPDGSAWQAAASMHEIAALPVSGNGGLVENLNPGRAPGSSLTSQYFNQPVKAVDLNATSIIERFPIYLLFNNVFATQAPPPGALAFRSRAALFGHNAPAFKALPSNLTVGEFVWNSSKSTYDFVPGIFNGRSNTWADDNLADYLQNGPPSTTDAIAYLNNSYPGITASSYVVLQQGGTWTLHQVQHASDTSYADFTLSAKVTQLTLDNSDGFTDFTIRGTTVYGQSERLSMARLPIPDPVAGSRLDLEGAIVGLYAGQGLLVCGELSTDLGNTTCEYVTIADIVYNNDDEGYTTLTLTGNGLSNSYVRTSVTIYGNVAPATHGETRQEILGSGDASVPFQTFTLHQSPLTYISASNPSGVQSSLLIYVNDVLWQEVPFFYGHGPTEHIYTTRSSDDHVITVRFGDGVTGARVPSGVNNVSAVYRTGIGLSGLVKANQLTLLLTQAAGLKSVTNPQDASGAADAEQRDDARQNAPLPVLTLDRIVSLLDYEDFAHAFPGIAKALAAAVWDGQHRGVFLTIAGSQGAAIPADSQIYSNLVAAIQQAGNPFIPLQVATYTQRFFRIVGTMQIEQDYLPDKVQQAVEAALRTTFSFDARNFGQAVSLGEVMATIQDVQGVVAANLTALYRSYPPNQEPVQLNEILQAALPRPESGLHASPAELLTLDPGPLNLQIL